MFPIPLSEILEASSIIHIFQDSIWLPLLINSFRGMALCGGQPKGVLYRGVFIIWSIFYLSCPPWGVCMYLLSPFQLVLWFMCSYSLFFLFATPKPHYQHVSVIFSIWKSAISMWITYLLGTLFKLLSHNVFYIANSASAQAKWLSKLNFPTQWFKLNARIKGN